MGIGIWQIIIIIFLLAIIIGLGFLFFGGKKKKTRLKYVGVWFLYIIIANLIAYGVSAFLTAGSRIWWVLENYWIEPIFMVLCFTVPATVIYSLFKSLDKSRIVPWFYGLHLLGLLMNIARTAEDNKLLASEYGINTTSWYVALILCIAIHVFWFHWFFVIRVRNNKRTEMKTDAEITNKEELQVGEPKDNIDTNNDRGTAPKNNNVNSALKLGDMSQKFKDFD